VPLDRHDELVAVLRRAVVDGLLDRRDRPTVALHHRVVVQVPGQRDAQHHHDQRERRGHDDRDGLVPVSASPSPAPTTSMMAAIAPITTPQNTTTQREGSMVPRCESVPMTIDAASAPDTKKIATRSIATIENSPPAGIESSRPNSWPSVSCPARSVPLRCRLIGGAAEDGEPDQADRARDQQHPDHELADVRPRLIRAMNMPTNGVQEIHQAQ
jgi:hypothetical protein